MKTSSRKAKGRALQNHVVAKVLTSFPSLEPADVRGAIMGENGEDIKLSPKAKKLFNFSVECKNQEKYKGVYDCFDQIEGHKDNVFKYISRYRHKHAENPVKDLRKAEWYLRRLITLTEGEQL